MKVGMAQITPILGDVKKNFDLHVEYIEKAKKKNMDLLIFPELSLTGYTLKDLVEEVALDPKADPLFKQLKDKSKDISFVLGFVEEKEKGLFYNSAAFLSGGKILHIHRKVFLPTYGIFEEAKFFGQGKNFITFTSPFGKVGMMICYDFLHYGASYLLFSGGAEIIIVISAAPGRGFTENQCFASCRMWEVMGETISHFSTSFVFYCNRVGLEDGKYFAGGSFIFNPAGNLEAQAPYLDKKFLIQDINLADIRESRKKRPYTRDNKPEIVLEALKRIVNKYED
ncbi:nitrilase-related carbon-nitrogen hydrolase [Acidobacteriota bacterium]